MQLTTRGGGDVFEPLDGEHLYFKPSNGKWILYGQEDVDRADIMLIETETGSD